MNTQTAEPDRKLFWACFIALVATAFGFIVRTNVIGEWGAQFDLDETQKGELFGVGLWPFAISIVLFSLVIDRIGYGTAMAFAFACHVSSTLLLIFATGYSMLYVGTFIFALGCGTVEAVINPVVATMFSREKTKWLNILHAGWPGGLVLAGLLAIGMGDARWTYKVALLLIPTAIYGMMMLGCRFPVSERVAAGVSHRAMLQEGGFLGAVIVVALIVFQLGAVFGIESAWVKVGVTAAISVAYGVYVQSLGRPMFAFLLLIMVLLATTELGVDSWITPLMEIEMKARSLSPSWVLVYTSFIMMVLRFCAGPIVHRLSPLGLLAACSAIAAIGLVALSGATGFMILVAATLYGVGKTFFWPTMIGIVSERFPRGGAMTLNATGGVGMLGVGLIGAVLLGNIQDKAVDRGLAAYDRKQGTALHAKYIGAEKTSVFGKYRSLDATALKNAPAEDGAIIQQVRGESQKGALMTTAIFPTVMLGCYLALLLYFRSRGGYRAVEIHADAG